MKNNKNADTPKNEKILQSCCSIKIPDIDIHEYIDKILDNITNDVSYIYDVSYVSDIIDIDCLIIHSIIVINRIIKNGKNLNDYNCHRIIGISILISLKIYHDNHYDNKHMSIIMGTNVKDFNRMEIDILEYIDYNVFIKREEMFYIVKSLIY